MARTTEKMKHQNNKGKEEITMRTSMTYENVTPTNLGRLPTSRQATRQERAVLAVLRSKSPRRALTGAEAECIAEWQATCLLELAGLGGPPTPSALIPELPRVLVRAEPDLPVSACAQWRSGRWLILLNSREPVERQRFSLAHEYKHVIDHPLRHLLYHGSYPAGEQTADYFAACLLMPRGWVKRAWGAGHQRTSQLCDLFQVSPPAMARRLEHLGLRDRTGEGVAEASPLSSTDQRLARSAT